ncbi:MAG: DUF3820 family protein [Spirochaetes bacterium]|nr:DUF3820 family protein [Spirochaetota bacterium]MCK5268932.1 DUF3820 family protein [Spirochaetota bacterium]
MTDMLSDPSVLLKLIKAKMPFGKYRDRLIIDIPEDYLLWFADKGFPEGELGQMMALMYQIRINGLEYLLEPLLNTENM